MFIAINTESLSKNTPEAVAKAAALGFKHIEVNLQTDEYGNGYKRKPNVRFYRELKKQIDGLGLSVWSVTTTPLTQEQMFFERARKDIFLGNAGAAGILEAKVVVVRPADIFTSEINFETYLREKTAPPMIEGYDEGWVQVVNRRMIVALLNHDHWLGIPLTNSAERMALLTEDLAVGWAFDVTRGLNRGQMADWLEKLNERMAVAYAYDLLDDGETICAPISEKWGERAAALNQTRLKCLVLRANPRQSADEIKQSYDYLAGLF